MLKHPEQSQKCTTHTGSGHLLLGWIGFVSRIIFALRPLTQRYQTDTEDKLFGSWGNIQPDVAEALLQIRMSTKGVRTDTAEWHLDFFCHWQPVWTGSILLIPLKTQGVRQLIQELHICFVDTSLWKYPCRPQSEVEMCEQHKTHLLVAPSAVTVW